MRRLLPLMPFLLFILLAGVFYFSLGRNTMLTANGMVGKVFPEFQLPTLMPENEPVGEFITLASLQDSLEPGQPWLLNVWASWCPQCYMEHGFIEAAASAGAQLIGLNYKDEPHKGLGFLAKMGNPYQLILLDKQGELGLDLGVSGAPETYLIGSDSRILARHAGVLDRAVWDQKFAALWMNQSGKALFNDVNQTKAQGE